MATDTLESLQTIHVVKEVAIAAPIDIAFESLVEELGSETKMPDGSTMSMKIEPRPGGRYYRDLGNNAGHFWGFVQVIKPPILLEICGPMFMSYPVSSHIQYRLTATDGGSTLKLTHRAFGQIPDEHIQGVNKGWERIVNNIAERAAKRAKR